MALNAKRIPEKIGARARHPSPVVALTLIDAQTMVDGKITPDTKILTTVRDPNSNATHPNVVSVPTQRVPKSLFRTFLKAATVTSSGGPIRRFLGNVAGNMSDSSHHPLLFTVESLLCRKLCLSEALENEQFQFSAQLCITQSGSSHYPMECGDGVISEPISMANIMVVVTKGAELIPTASASYSRIFWIDTQKFLHAAKNKDPLVLNGLDPLQFCIHGLCIATTCELLSAKLNQ